MTSDGTLTLLPMLPAAVAGDRVVLTRKFLEGLREYAGGWDGPLRVVMRPQPDVTDNLDNVEVDPSAEPFELAVRPFEHPEVTAWLRASNIVKGGLDHHQVELPATCRSAGVPMVMVSEYSLATRLQIARAEESNPLRRWRRSWWERGTERRYRRALGAAAGLQANGTPTFGQYEALTPHPLLYFDSRVERADLVGRAALDARLRRLAGGERLRLAFSGRWNRMKGVDHLVRVAERLARQEVPFELSLFGGGELADSLAREVARLDLGGHVQLRGVLDFQTELMPTVKREVDLFVCCHRQGDPSCTYLETFACGVPIVGYDNEALSGLLELVPAGQCTPMDDVDALAGLVRELAWKRERLAEWSLAAREFAGSHLFEDTFERRLEHLREVAAATGSRSPTASGRGTRGRRGGVA